MTRFMTVVAALAAFAAPGANMAFAGEGGLRATLAQPNQNERLVAHGLLWHCAGDQCAAPAGNSRPVIACQALAKVAGPVSSFGSRSDKLDAEQLARCNSASETQRMAAAK